MRDVEVGERWAEREFQGEQGVVIRLDLLHFGERADDGDVRYVVSPAIQHLEATKVYASWWETGHLVPNYDQRRKLMQRAELLRNFLDLVERDIEILESGRLPDRLRKFTELVVGDVESGKGAYPREVPRELLHAIVLDLEGAESRDVTQPSVIEVSDAIA